MPGQKPGILASLMEIADKKRVFYDARFPYNRKMNKAIIIFSVTALCIFGQGCPQVHPLHPPEQPTIK